MPNSGTVTAGSAALASQYNNLRDDVLNTSTGHTHTGASENGAKVEGTALKATGVTDGYLLTADGSGGVAWEALAAAGADVQEFTSNGSWVKPSGKSAVFVFAVGAGGGGGGGAIGTASDSYGGPGGGGGAHAQRWFVASALPGTVTVTIGAGGAGGTAAASGSVAANGSHGTNGGDTSFGTAILASGGLGGEWTDNDAVAQSSVGVAEWGRRANDATVNANFRTSDAISTTRSFTNTTAANYSIFLAPGRGGSNIYPTVRAMTRTGGGGSGGYGAATSYDGGAGGRGFGFDGTIAVGGTAGGGAGSSASEGIGCGGGGGGGRTNGTAGNGGNGYLGGGGGGGGAAFRSTGNVRPGAGGNGGGGYILVISV